MEICDGERFSGLRISLRLRKGETTIFTCFSRNNRELLVSSVKFDKRDVFVGVFKYIGTI